MASFEIISVEAWHEEKQRRGKAKDDEFRDNYCRDLAFTKPIIRHLGSEARTIRDLLKA